MLEPQDRDPSVVSEALVYGIRPTDDIYVGHSGPTFNGQDANGVAIYEINASGDTIDFDLSGKLGDFDTPVVQITTIFGSTDFTVEDRPNNSTITSDVSGFDSDVWYVDISGTSFDLRLTNFNDTQAAFYPFVKVFDA